MESSILKPLEPSSRKPIKLQLKRIEAGITALDFASALQISPTKLSLIENQHIEPEHWIKEQSTEILNIPYEDLWGEDK